MTNPATIDQEPTFIEVGEGDGGRRIAVRARAGSGPGLFWLGGFNSDMRGTKALALDAWAAEHGRACIRFDYSGHGDRAALSSTAPSGAGWKRPSPCSSSSPKARKS